LLGRWFLCGAALRAREKSKKKASWLLENQQQVRAIGRGANRHKLVSGGFGFRQDLVELDFELIDLVVGEVAELDSHV
jgi:hypothetical protein